MYKSKPWTLVERHENRIIVFEKKVLRKYTGPIKEEGEITELWLLYKNSNFKILITKVPNAEPGTPQKLVKEYC